MAHRACGASLAECGIVTLVFIAQGRTFFQIAPWTILIPGGFLALTVLAVNLLGDGLRDRLDPRLARRL